MTSFSCFVKVPPKLWLFFLPYDHEKLSASHLEITLWTRTGGGHVFFIWSRGWWRECRDVEIIFSAPLTLRLLQELSREAAMFLICSCSAVTSGRSISVCVSSSCDVVSACREEIQTVIHGDTGMGRGRKGWGVLCPCGLCGRCKNLGIYYQ